MSIGLLSSTQEITLATMKQSKTQTSGASIEGKQLKSEAQVSKPAKKDKGKAPVEEEPKSKIVGSGLVVGETVYEYGYPVHDQSGDEKKLREL